MADKSDISSHYDALTVQLKFESWVGIMTYFNFPERLSDFDFPGVLQLGNDKARDRIYVSMPLWAMALHFSAVELPEATNRPSATGCHCSALPLLPPGWGGNKKPECFGEPPTSQRLPCREAMTPLHPPDRACCFLNFSAPTPPMYEHCSCENFTFTGLWSSLRIPPPDPMWEFSCWLRDQPAPSYHNQQLRPHAIQPHQDSYMLSSWPFRGRGVGGPHSNSADTWPFLPGPEIGPTEPANVTTTKIPLHKPKGGGPLTSFTRRCSAITLENGEPQCHLY